MPSKFPWILKLAALSCLMLLGCGGDGKKEGTVEGKVTIDGTPANSGTVVMTSSDGKSISGMIQSDGQYRVIGVPLGEAKVTVKAPQMPKGMTLPADPMGGKAEKPIPIPAKYEKPESSGLTCTVKAGVNQFPINLTK